MQRLETPEDRRARSKAGKRSYSQTTRKRGRYIRSRQPSEKTRDLAFDATLRAAAPHQKTRDRAGTAIAVEASDIREKVRVRRTSNVILFAVDASWSMSAVERIRAARGAVLSLLQDAYQRRDEVGLVVFRGRSARLALPPTSSVDHARKALADLPVGGKTPLSAGLLLSHQVLARHRRAHPQARPLLILLTDGAGNVSVSGRSPDEETRQIARNIQADSIHSVVINLENPMLESGLARALARALGGPCHTVAALRADTLHELVRRELS